MMPPLPDNEDRSPEFTATHWSIVLEARHTDPQRAQTALETLCARYWYPLYAFVRRRGHDPHEAEDLTQSFFAYLLRKDALLQVDPGKGLFRTFLLSSLTNFLNDQWDRRQALKRGGGKQLISWDALEGESRFQAEPEAPLAPEKLFERRWAMTLIERVLLRLRREYETGGKLQQFQRLEPCLTGAIGQGFYEEAAAALGMKAGAVRVALHRLRRRLGEVLRSEVAQTVATPEEIDEEIRCLFAALGN
jgi:RNA polymerase sigma-70 factor (ECF subfamily)